MPIGIAHTWTLTYTQNLRRLNYHTTELKVLQGCYKSHSINHIKEL